jgi:ligand-binding SRPBCC domain-containing protein
MYQFKTEQFLPVAIVHAWDFFSSPKNLALITPPEMDFKIISKLTAGDIFEGMKIDYTIKPIFGIPLSWRTEICDIQKLKYFTDKQLKGPYKSWEHTHTFIETDGGVLMKDEINYQLPAGMIGNLVHSLFVRKKLDAIFTFRKNTLEKLFARNENNPH